MTKQFNRRTMLGGIGAAAVLSAAGTGVARAATSAAGPIVTEDRRRAVVVGTGFGGSITALRLGRAGVPTLVLERGQRWITGPNADTFPRMFSQDRRASWFTASPVFTGSPPALWKPYAGVIERFRGDGMDILCGSGVGGGSLVYHGMTIQPGAAGFARSMPAGLDYTAFDRDYYRRVEAVLKPAPIPDDLLDSSDYKAAKQFTTRVTDAGLEPFRVPLPLDWEYARREQRGEMRRTYTTGDVILGANNGGKNTVDVTYLAAAEATGKVEVAVLHVVRDIERDPSGRWVVHVDRIDPDGTVLERKLITTDALFLGAGSAGTSRLLVKAKAKNTVSGLPDGVGTRWGNNGDRIFARSPSGGSPGKLQGGPACVGVKDWDNPAGPVTIVHGGVPLPVDAGITSLIGFGLVTPGGVFTYDATKDDAVLHWSQTYDKQLTDAITARIRTIVGGNLTVDTTAFETTTYHPLGGATIGDVCDLYGRVQGQKGLYVTDGALIPGSTGACNPSMTIAALAEHSMDTIVRDDVNTVF